jgi:hypothetical protein
VFIKFCGKILPGLYTAKKHHCGYLYGLYTGLSTKIYKIDTSMWITFDIINRYYGILYI